LLIGFKILNTKSICGWINVLQLEDKEFLDGVGFVEVEAGVAADFPDVFHWVDAGDGWFVDDLEVFD